MPFSAFARMLVWSSPVGQHRLSCLGAALGILGGQQPYRASSLPLKQAVCIEMPTFENKDFAYLGFYKSGPYTPGFSPLFPSVK